MRRAAAVAAAALAAAAILAGAARANERSLDALAGPPSTRFT